MRIAHIADPLIGAIADFYMPREQDEQWQKERMEAFSEACDSAVKRQAELILLTGALFAEGYSTDAVISRTLEVIREKKAVFVWRPDQVGRQYLRHKAEIPSNLFLLDSEGQGEFLLKDAHIMTWSGRGQARDGCNILIFDTARDLDRSSLEVMKKALPELLYAAAGGKHYILENGTFREEPSGKLENTGFDDPDDSGYVLLELEKGRLKSREKIRMARYRFQTLRVEVEKGDDSGAVYRKCAAAAAGLTRRDFARIILNGSVDVGTFIRTDSLRDSLRTRFFYLEVFNNCRLELDEEAYANDISLKSELIRMVLAEDSLSESEKSRIIQCGWNALSGKELPE